MKKLITLNFNLKITYNNSLMRIGTDTWQQLTKQIWISNLVN